MVLYNYRYYTVRHIRRMKQEGGGGLIRILSSPYKKWIGTTETC